MSIKRGGIERRKKIRDLYLKDIVPSEIISMVASEFGCSERTVWRDWKSREEWMPAIQLGENSLRAYMFTILENLVTREHLLVNLESEPELSKIKICRTVWENYLKEFESARLIGRFDPSDSDGVLMNLVEEFRRTKGADLLVPSNLEGTLRRRRRRILYYYLLGFSVVELCDRVESELGCSSRTVRREFNDMDKWLGSLFYWVEPEPYVYRLLKMDLFELNGVLFKIINESTSKYNLKRARIVLAKYNAELLMDEWLKQNYVKKYYQKIEIEKRMEARKRIKEIFEKTKNGQY